MWVLCTGCVVRDDTASQDDNDTISSLSSRLSVMCNAGSSASLGGGGDVIPGGDNVVISGSHRSACHGGPVGGHPSSLVGEQALRLFADDLSAVSHLVKSECFESANYLSLTPAVCLSLHLNTTTAGATKFCIFLYTTSWFRSLLFECRCGVVLACEQLDA